VNGTSSDVLEEPSPPFAASVELVAGAGVPQKSHTTMAADNHEPGPHVTPGSWRRP